METTPGALWARHNQKEPIARWWTPHNETGYDVEYAEGQEKDWEEGLELGSGAVGFVHRVHLGGKNGVVVARKQFRLRGRAQEAVRVSIKTEIDCIRQLHHIHVVEIVGSYVTPEELGFFMRPCARATLADLLDLGNTPNFQKELEQDSWGGKSLPDFLASTVGCLANGLMYLHGRLGEDKAVKHKDIKPDNILIDGDRVVLADFDISKIVELHNTTSDGVTGRTKKVSWYPNRRFLFNMGD
jgi:serine/threonine protein kinase